MPIHRLHIDFIRFLDEIEKGGSPWEAYKHNYLLPNSVFLETYWEKLDITLSQIKERVERVKKTDYSNLLTLLQDSDLGTLVETTIHRCGEFLKAPYPDVLSLIHI